ncbi:MAG: response regulator [Lachnospiraceae bacterium]|nr:response regulator [Lachnospiraceae bacterium]
MEKDHIIITGEKESFLIRVLIKKIQDEGIPCRYVGYTIDALNAALDGACLVILYMESGFVQGGKVMHFLVDRLTEKGLQMIPIGEENDILYMKDNVRGDLMYRTYTRPVDNEKFAETITELYNRIAAGEFRKTVLIVDDDPGFMSVVRDWLRDDYKVAMANSGLQAIKWLGKNKADLILLDYEMPITTGPQVLEMLRGDSETRDIPVMFLTGKNDKESVMKVLELKPEGYFLKTIGRSELREKLSEFFRGL